MISHTNLTRNAALHSPSIPIPFRRSTASDIPPPGAAEQERIAQGEREGDLLKTLEDVRVAHAKGAAAEEAAVAAAARAEREVAEAGARGVALREQEKQEWQMELQLGAERHERELADSAEMANRDRTLTAAQTAELQQTLAELQAQLQTATRDKEAAEAGITAEQQAPHTLRRMHT